MLNVGGSVEGELIEACERIAFCDLRSSTLKHATTHPLRCLRGVWNMADKIAFTDLSVRAIKSPHEDKQLQSALATDPELKSAS